MMDSKFIEPKSFDSKYPLM